jgi:hypothetical protein
VLAEKSIVAAQRLSESRRWPPNQDPPTGQRRGKVGASTGSFGRHGSASPVTSFYNTPATLIACRELKPFLRVTSRGLTPCVIRWRCNFSTGVSGSTSYTSVIETSSRASSTLACPISGEARPSAGSSGPGRSRCRSDHATLFYTSPTRVTVRPSITFNGSSPRPSCPAAAAVSQLFLSSSVL